MWPGLDFSIGQGNLGIGMPNLTLENGEEVGFTDSLLIWPRMTGEPELGVLLL